MPTHATDTATLLHEHFASLAPEARQELEAIRETIHGAVPDAVESFSYSMPAFTLDGQPLVW